MTTTATRVGIEPMGRERRATWRVRLIAALPVAGIIAVQPAMVGFARIAASPVDEDVPAPALDLIGLAVRLLVATVPLVAIGASLLALLETKRAGARGGWSTVPWFLGSVPLLYLAARAVILRRAGYPGAGPLVLAIVLLAAGGLILLAELVAVVLVALQHSVPLT